MNEPPRAPKAPWRALVRRYLTSHTLSAAVAAAFLRAAFVVAFMAQCVAAALVGVTVTLLAGGAPRNPSALLAWILVAIALAQTPVVVFVVARLGALRSGPGARRAALSAALMTGVMLASSAWFLALALATGQAGTPLFVLLFLTLSGYALGFMLVGRLARAAASEVVGEPHEEEAGSAT
ncbi:MAG: hypothetical protein WDA03_10100 [Trueperaceae bacterium]